MWSLGLYFPPFFTFSVRWVVEFSSLHKRFVSVQWSFFSFVQRNNVADWGRMGLQILPCKALSLL
uniref:Uncharacterized protein n=1 Tax=Trypanosoma congolense (strain IL3000) TaxID=1068625 RepID=G0V0E3_TRYCI|nr:hypothetical protein, unlikely [Trypanosoma congolense IL3000]